MFIDHLVWKSSSFYKRVLEKFKDAWIYFPYYSILLKVFFIIPCIDIYEKIDLRTQTYDVPPQEVRMKIEPPAEKIVIA